MDDRSFASLSRDEFLRLKIYDGLKAALRETPLKKITVNQLCESSGVSRSTFYRTFDNIDAVLSWSNLRIMKQAVQESLEDATDSWKESQIGVLTLCLRAMFEEREFYSLVYKDMSRTDYSGIYLSSLRESIEYFGEFVEERTGGPLDDQAAFEVSFFIKGVSQAIVDWSAEGMQEEPRVYAERIVDCIPAHLVSLLDERRRE